MVGTVRFELIRCLQRHAQSEVTWSLMSHVSAVAVNTPNGLLPFGAAFAPTNGHRFRTRMNPQLSINAPGVGFYSLHAYAFQPCYLLIRIPSAQTVQNLLFTRGQAGMVREP